MPTTHLEQGGEALCLHKARALSIQVLPAVRKGLQCRENIQRVTSYAPLQTPHPPTHLYVRLLDLHVLHLGQQFHVLDDDTDDELYHHVGHK